MAGIPSELGLIAQTPTGFMTAQLYSCRWMPGLGGVDHFLTTNLSECTGVSGVAAPLGYVMP